MTMAGSAARPPLDNSRVALVTNRILKILLPMRLPTAMSVSLLLNATRLAVTSGMEVPTATMVSPIMASEMPSSLAMDTDAFKMVSPPAYNVAQPTIKKRTPTGRLWAAVSASSASKTRFFTVDR